VVLIKPDRDHSANKQQASMLIPMIIRSITDAEAVVASTWRYRAPYSIYDNEPADRQRFLVPEYRYHAVLSANDLIGYCCFGPDARVAGGSYPTDALDIGAGMRPDLVGRGHGRAFLTAILHFAATTYSPRAFTATVAAFNQRALSLCRSVGFAEQSRFVSSGDDPREFVILQCST
jgi:[ribosomal protein S18]-alanine N-acetyltransferase